MKNFVTTNLVILDSSVWIASLLEKDYFHHQSLRLISKYNNPKYRIIIPLPVVLEIINVCLQNNLNQELVRRSLSDLLKYHHQKIYSIDTELLTKCAFQYARKLKLKSQDFTISLYCAILKPQFFESYDKRLILAIRKL